MFLDHMTEHTTREWLIQREIFLAIFSKCELIKKLCGVAIDLIFALSEIV